MPDAIETEATPAPVPVVDIAFHPVLVKPEAQILDKDSPPRDTRIGSDNLTAVEVEIVAAEPAKRRGERLFIGGVKEAGAWLERRGYRWVPFSNGRWAA